MVYLEDMTNTTPITCTKCGRELASDKVVELELNCTTLTWHTPGTVSEEDSQGVWDFGPDCAKAARRASAKTNYSRWANF